MTGRIFLYFFSLGLSSIEIKYKISYILESKNKAFRTFTFVHCWKTVVISSDLFKNGYMKKSFLLNSETAEKLYEKVKFLPIVDYHNHLSFEDIKANKRFTNIYDLWIKPDPYKHRAMRMCGVSEKYITGDALDFEKFKAWCSVVPKLIGNPLYV